MAVSIQQAAANALAAFLATKMVGIPVIPQWPSPDKELPNKAITIVSSGSRRDIPIEAKLLKSTNNGLKNVDAVWQIAACTQPLQLDVWAHTDYERDQILADLDIYLNYGDRALGVGNYDIGNGLLLNLANGWEAYQSKADFAFEEPNTDDSGDSTPRRSYRATYRGNAYFQLAVPATVPRQLLINFSMFLDGDTTATTYNTDL